MKLFRCSFCNQPLYFESVRCDGCGHRLGFSPVDMRLHPLVEGDDGEWRQAGGARVFRFCANERHGACSWLVEMQAQDEFCLACQHNLTIPSLASPVNLRRWRRIELAKRRLMYQLLRLDLPRTRRPQDPDGLAWNFLEDESDGTKVTPVLTGHISGLITINIAEADDVERERRRIAMHEPYRSLLGHFRHEIGHYYWMLLVLRSDDPSVLPRFREVFGDETRDYAQSLQQHYNDPVPAGWEEQFISPYSAAHPWEDWAEVWAHYFHMIDTLETAREFGLELSVDVAQAPGDNSFDAYAANLQDLMKAWIPLTFAMNSISRSMGQPDSYPFLINPAVVGKLAFIHERIHARERSLPDEDVIGALAATLSTRVSDPR